YEAKAVMNMGEVLLEDYMEEENISPKKGKIKTSVGDINIKKKSEINYQLTITLENGEIRSEEHTSELQSRLDLVCRLLPEKKRRTAKCPARPTTPMERRTTATLTIS